MVARFLLVCPLWCATVQPVFRRCAEKSRRGLGACVLADFYQGDGSAPALLNLLYGVCACLHEYGSVIFIAGNVSAVRKSTPLIIIGKLARSTTLWCHRGGGGDAGDCLCHAVGHQPVTRGSVATRRASRAPSLRRAPRKRAAQWLPIGRRWRFCRCVFARCRWPQCLPSALCQGWGAHRRLARARCLGRHQVDLDHGAIAVPLNLQAWRAAAWCRQAGHEFSGQGVLDHAD